MILMEATTSIFLLEAPEKEGVYPSHFTPNVLAQHCRHTVPALY
jgi:hypothetical protein